MRVAFLASNDTHVLMFADVADVLEGDGHEVTFLALDAFYRQGAAEAAAARGRAAVVIPSRRPAPRAFYRRPALAIVRDALAARRPLREVLGAVRPDVVVLGNDSGLLEKAVLSGARSRGTPSVLVQDGRLGARPVAAGPAARLRRTLRTVATPLLRSAGLGDLASSSYGAGGATVVCAMGPAGASLIRTRATRSSRVIETGQPRYDALAPLIGRQPDAGPFTVAMLTTPFAAAGLGDEAQRAQERFASDLAEALPGQAVQLLVKPHPREDPAAYRRVVGAANVHAGPAAVVIARAHAALIGISTVVDEAGILGRPVLVPGAVVHGSRFEDRLPDPSAYPRLESTETALRSILRLADRSSSSDWSAELVARQREAVAREIRFDPAWSASEAVARAIVQAATAQLTAADHTR